MGPNENAALLEATFRVLLFVVALTAAVWLTVRIVAARRQEFTASEPEHEREECTEEFTIRPTGQRIDDDRQNPYL